jgi:hypothetical protein
MRGAVVCRGEAAGARQTPSAGRRMGVRHPAAAAGTRRDEVESDTLLWVLSGEGKGEMDEDGVTETTTTTK